MKHNFKNLSTVQSNAMAMQSEILVDLPAMTDMFWKVKPRQCVKELRLDLIGATKPQRVNQVSFLIFFFFLKRFGL